MKFLEDTALTLARFTTMVAGGFLFAAWWWKLPPFGDVPLTYVCRSGRHRYTTHARATACCPRI